MNPETHSLPIGIFDSGLGGLTIVKAIQSLLPHEQLIYFGDTAHLPYGDKSPALIQTYAAAISRMLIQQGVKAIVIACNTASAVAFRQIQEVAREVPVFNVITPAVNEALKATLNGRVGIIGTKTTIRTSIYRKLLLAKSSKLEIIEKATPLLVPMIEEGWLHNQVSQDVIDAYMSDTGFEHIDTLILGCTHYPLVKSQIDQYFKENYTHAIRLIDSSEAVAKAVKEALAATQLLSLALEKVEHKYYLSDMSPHFEASAELFLGKNVSFNSCKLTV